MSKKKLKVKIKPLGILDLMAFKNLVSNREKVMASGSNARLKVDPMNKLARKLHPDRQYLVIGNVKKETKSTRTFRLIADPESETKSLANFRAGQYLSIKAEVDGVATSRPYSLSSAPSDLLKNGYYEITVKKVANGFMTDHMWKNWKVGTKVECSDPTGLFYYEPIRDGNNVVGIAGGSGITPFRSLAREMVNGDSDLRLTVLYGSSDENDIVFYEDLKRLEDLTNGRLKVVNVLSCENPTLKGCKTGFISQDVIKKYSDPAKSVYFLCGPEVMYRFAMSELGSFKLRRKQIRRELFSGTDDVTRFQDFPKDVAGCNCEYGRIEKKYPGQG
ncbi:MAG: hypothetical protein JRH15_18765 [Deltaproteobacteria bacterium]|nr:hypothetical protein [Deltaproteobacteria bacterium]